MSSVVHNLDPQNFTKSGTHLRDLSMTCARNDGPSGSDECEGSFQKLKTLLISTHVLTLPEEGVDFTIYYDASRVELDGVLIQKVKQFDDEKLWLIYDKVVRGEPKEVVLDSNGFLMIGGRIFMPKMNYHPSQHYWWCGMKRNIANFVLRCLTCQQVKCENQQPQGLPTTVGGYDSIWVVVDRLTKSIHFISVQGRLLIAQSRQKSYADQRVRSLVFMEGDHVWL
ncbi:hypothetical protein MTR67_023836 [Solanum verrucosum]|uniref:Integrase zinc-binding domain-containing protein n=1 Tax=Solanum verrucosum TaxID=315347 RepID=A0AAF0QVY3_SOLVR|nr:hypothetical protein MTR67_023836 [Solanum verrucosum]